MKFLLQKAISLIDIGTSFIYYLLGRELDSHDIKIINYLFSLDQQHNKLDYEIDIIRSLNKGKDLLLVTNQDNLNILQLCILKQRLNIIKALLDYGCDPNRGSTIVNHSHHDHHTQSFYDYHDHLQYPIKIYQQQSLPQQQEQRRLQNKNKKKTKKMSKSLYSLQQVAAQADVENSQHSQYRNSLQHHRVSDTTNQSSLLTVNINTTPSIPQSSSQQLVTEEYRRVINEDDYDDNDEDDGYEEFIENDDDDDDDDEEEDDVSSREASSDENDALIVYDSPLLLACCVYNCHNLEYLISNSSSSEEFVAGRNKKQQQRSHNEDYSSYYNYYYAAHNSAVDLNETMLTSSSSSSSSSTTLSTTSDKAAMNDSQATAKNINYLEIDDDDLYYQKYDLDFTLVPQEVLDDSQQAKKKSNSSSSLNEKYRLMNDLRLKLVDMLLDYGANKYQYSKLSENSLRYLNKRSRRLIENYFKLSSSPSLLQEMTTNTAENEFYLKTKQISPLLVTLCFDDLELFKKLYENHKLLFNYIKPNEYKNLILFAIKAQAQNCLIYLLKNHKNLSQADHDIIFYIISNINSTKIIDLLLNIGFDLRLVNSNHQVKNTILHCLFESSANNKQILSKILLKLLNNVDLSEYINQYNQQNELCVQSLFECSTLVEKIFFINHQQHDLKLIFKLQTEFKETIKLLLKHNVCLFQKTGQHSSAIECLLSHLQVLIKKQLVYNKTTTNLFCMSYLYDLFKEIFKFNQQPQHQHFESNLLAKFFEILILNELYINEFESALKIVKLLCKFESSSNGGAGLSITSSLIKKLLTLWISQPNYLNSRQYEKIFFIKNLFRILIAYGYDCNDTSLKYIDGCIQSNNLLHCLISILFNCQTGYQLDCLYDLMIYLVQYGANPNIEPYELEPKIIHCQSSIYLQKRPNYLLSQLCSPFNCGFNLIKRFSSVVPPVVAPVHSHNHHHHRHHHHSPTSSTHSSGSSSIQSTINQKIENWVFYNDFSSSDLTTPLATSQLLINHYKKFLNFFYEYMDTEIIYECLKYRDSSVSPCLPAPAPPATSSTGLYTQATLNSSDVLNLYLEKLCSKPRTLQSLTRRYIQKIVKKPIAQSVPTLPLPIRLQDYLLFNEIK